MIRHWNLPATHDGMALVVNETRVEFVVVLWPDGSFTTVTPPGTKSKITEGDIAHAMGNAVRRHQTSPPEET
jgi:hypothetical protein